MSEKRFTREIQVGWCLSAHKLYYQEDTDKAKAVVWDARGVGDFCGLNEVSLREWQVTYGALYG